MPRTGASLRNENDSSVARWSKLQKRKRHQCDALVSGCSKSHCNMAATFLVSRPGHDAATPTWKRQGSLVSADALPIAVGILRPRAMVHMT